MAIASACGQLNEFSRISDLFYTSPNYFDSFYEQIYDECQERDASLIEAVEKRFTDQGENKLCEKKCPIECNTVYYSIVPYYFRTSADHYESGYTEVNIYYESFYYTVIKQLPKTTVNTLYGVIGGLFGLFCGASFLTLVEILEVIYELIYEALTL